MATRLDGADHAIWVKSGELFGVGREFVESSDAAMGSDRGLAAMELGNDAGRWYCTDFDDGGTWVKGAARRRFLAGSSPSMLGC